MSQPEWVIVIGGSAGALGPLREIVSALPADLPASVLVVLHTSATGGVHLPQVIGRWTSFSVLAVAAPQPLAAGRLYVASPDHHLKVNGAGAIVTREPREHHVRPAVDVLFRSAARAFGPRTIGVVLSGYGSDGAAGALTIQSRGGSVIVQHPDDAEAPSMPLHAIRATASARVARAADVVRAIEESMRRTGEAAGGAHIMRDEEMRVVITRDIEEQERGERPGKVAVFTCPDCGGAMWQAPDGTFVDFSCHIGHRYGADTLLVQKTEQLEAALVTALRLLKEKAMILRQTASRARERGMMTAAERLEERAGIDDRYVEVLQRDLLEAEPSPLSNAVVDEEVTHAEGKRGDP